MQKNNQTAIIGVIIFGVLALGLTIYALTRNNSAPPAPNATEASTSTENTTQPKTYFVASRQILPRTRITRDMLMERQSDGHPIPANAITDPFQVVGQLANSIIQPGQVITNSATVHPVARVIPANIPVPPGLRAVAVWVNPTETTAGLVDVGDRVDVISTNKLKGKTAVSDSIDFVSGRTIAQDLQVLAVDKSINAPQGDAAKAGTPAPAANNKPAENSDASRTRVVLAATPQQAQRIAAANEAGTLHIIIRNPGDSAVLPTGESLEYPVHLVSTKTPASAAPAAPAPPAGNRNNQSGPYFPPPSTGTLPPATTTVSAPPPSHEVTVIRGTEKTLVALPK